MPLLSQSVLGSFLDPVADKVLIGSVMVTLGALDVLSPWLVALVVARDVCLVAGVAIIRWKTKPPGSPFFSLSHAKTFEITPSSISKVGPNAQYGVSVCVAYLFLVAGPCCFFSCFVCHFFPLPLVLPFPAA